MVKAHVDVSVFTLAVVVIKFGIMATLLVMSFIVADTAYIAQNPHRFLADCTLTGVSSALAIAVISVVRGHPEMAGNYAFIAFFVFFCFNVFREMSGYNSSAQLDQKQLNVIDRFKMPAIVVTGIICAVVASVAFYSSVPHPGGVVVFMSEALILASCIAVSDGIVARNHGKDGVGIAVTSGLSFATFFAIHVVLQLGGFFQHLYA